MSTTIGAGGGSIAWIDAGGALRVGPQSAGSEPGPACYGRGGEAATVTDASVDPRLYRPGLFRRRLAEARRRTGRARPIATDDRAAARHHRSSRRRSGIHRVLNAQMAEAIRLVSIGRGIDPRGYALLPLGGGGPLHATARWPANSAYRRIAVPPHPGVLSAAGLLSAPIEHESIRRLPARLCGRSTWPEVRATLDSLDAACGGLMRAENVPAERTQIRYFADVCYVGQSLSPRNPAAMPMPIRPDRDCSTATSSRRTTASTATAPTSPARIVNLRTVHRSPVDRPHRRRPNAPPGRTAVRRARPIGGILTAGSGRLIAGQCLRPRGAWRSAPKSPAPRSSSRSTRPP